MQQHKEGFNRVALLTGARIFGVIFSFAIPMYLGRHLEVDTYGTYKQVTLIYWFAQVALNLGLDDSVFYFLRWDKKNFPLFSMNALVFNVLVTGFLALMMTVFRFDIAALLNNPDLAQYLPVLGYLIVVTLCSLQIEGFLINFNRFKARLYLDAGTELLKSVAIMGAFILFDSIFIALALLSLVMTVRMLWMIYTMHSHKVREGVRYRDAHKFFMDQARYGLPLGVSRIVQNILNMENLFISSFYNVRQFTFYSVGCFENPIVNSLRTSLYELVNIELIDNIKSGNYEKAAETWRRMTRSLFLVVVPFTIYMMFFAKEMIVFIFSDKYVESVPFFIVFNFYIFIACLNPEPLFRSTSNTGYALKIKVLGVVLGLLMIIGGAYYIGPMAVLWGKILAVAFINISGLFIGARLLKTNILNLFMWKDLGKTVMLSVVFGFIFRAAFYNLTWHPFWVLAASSSVYAVFYFFFACRLNLVRPEEAEHLFNMIKKVFAKLGLIKKLEVARD
ncbi:lipopolysaccharide biosynthesis protein [Bdellovibrio sp. HCB274]|uniref:lipopolysaccharide biosynthesis protein n=1 Tax=Bdellovibrio sp. HCB274 TaxID=3394361 RepID=UPI0039B40C5F